jgi:hypothetical protein
MTYYIGEEVKELTHSGVKGMHWGVRKAETTGGSRSRSTARPKKKAVPKTPEAQAAHDLRMKIGKDVAMATVASIGALGVATLAGPVAGAAAGAAIRSVIQVGATKTSDSSFTGGGVKILGRTASGDFKVEHPDTHQQMTVDGKILESLLGRGMK